MGNLVRYTPSTGNTDREVSPGLWRLYQNEYGESNNGCAVINDDFTTFDISTTTGTGISGYDAAYDTGAAIANVDEVGGVIAFSSDGDNEGAMLGANISPFKITAGSGKPLWFEARIKTSTIADTKHGFFVGLIQAGAGTVAVPIATAGTLADTNFIGFHRLEGDGDKLDIVYKADGQTQVTKLADAVTLVADTYVKVGFYFDGKKSLKFYKNGVEIADTELDQTAMDAATFPSDITLGPIFQIMNATASTPGNSSLDWWKVAQEV